MKQLSGLDASFVCMESDRSPMHIGAVAFFAPAPGGFSFQQFRELVAARVSSTPVFRQRLAHVPLALGRPFWVNDSHFQLDLHVHHEALPAPGARDELRALVEYIFSQPLSLARPPWSLTFVEGINGFDDFPTGSFALIYKVHHAAADGMTGVNVFTSLLTEHPQPWKSSEAVDSATGESPAPLSLLWRSWRNNLLSPRRTLTSLVELAGGLGRVGMRFSRSALAPHLPFTAPHSRFNQAVSSARAFDSVIFKLDDIKAIKNAADGATVNDVVLAICAGGLRTYLEDKGELPDQPLLAMVPISVRSSAEESGNQVSAMMVSLATDEVDPRARLQRIHSETENSKDTARAMGNHSLADVLQFVPFSLGQMITALYTHLLLSDHHRPLFNLVITNVPGPMQALYLGEAEMLVTEGTAPLFDGLGLMIVVTSYHGKLSISLTACRKLVPDIAVLSEHMQRSFLSLKNDVAGTARKPRARSRNKRYARSR